VTGITTTVSFHKKVLSHRDFADGLVDTGFVERTWFG
jgi:biotin carboxylase